MKNKSRILKVFSGIKDENLKALTAQLVQVYREHEDAPNRPLAAYRRTIDAFADEFGDRLDTTFETPELPGNPATAATSYDHEPTLTLNTISLRNFGAYAEDVTFTLEPNGNRNVTAIIGSNADGKTTLFTALNWAMYGDEFLGQLKTDRGLKVEDLVNRGALSHALTNHGTVLTEVRLGFAVKGKLYEVTRSLSTSTSGSETSHNFVTQMQPTRLVRIDPDGNYTQLRESTLASLMSGLPSHVRDFYLFDGERINRFVAPGSQVQIRKAIRRVMGIEALEKTAEDIAAVTTNYRRDAKDKASGELAEVAAKIETLANQKAAATTTIDEKRIEVVALESRLDELNRHLESAPDTGPLLHKRQSLEVSLQQNTQDEERLIFELRDLAADVSMLWADESVTNLISLLDTRREKGEIPGPVSRQQLTDLLEQGTCICGTDLNDNPNAADRLQQALKLLDRKAEAELQMALFYGFGTISTVLIDRASNFTKRRRDLSSLRRQRLELRDSLKEIESSLEGIPQIDRAGWERERQSTLKQLGSVHGAMQSAKDMVQRLNAEISMLKREEAKLEETQAGARTAAQRRDWSDAAYDALRHIFTTFAAFARVEIQDSTARLWHTMLPNVAPYKVTVTEDFQLLVHDSLDRPSMQKLSMGQQQCLGLSFITAVAQVSESRPPLVIDMPFGRLGDEVAASVASTLPRLTEQLILFVLPGTEWNEHTRTASLPYLAREYRIAYSKEHLRTSMINAAQEVE